MILSHDEKKPVVHPHAYIASNTTICGEVTIAVGCRVMFGTCVIAEGKPTKIGENVADRRKVIGWEYVKGHKLFRSWLCVPLAACEEFLRFLSLGHAEPNHVAEDHLRPAIKNCLRLLPSRRS